MKLKKIWKHLDWSCDINLWYADHPWVAECDFKKVVLHTYDKLPKKFRNYELIKDKYNDGTPAIWIYPYQNANKANLADINVVVVKKQ